MALANAPRENYEGLPTRGYRRGVVGLSFSETYAMHWDGTYRDRVAGPDRRFWPEISGFNPRPARSLARHLA